MYRAIYHSPIGPLHLVFQNDCLINLSFSEEMAAHWVKRLLRRTLPEQRPLPRRLEQDLDDYFQGRLRHFDWQLRLVGTPFQERVWKALLEIPHGQTATYKAVGEKCGCRGYRAIGRAVGTNPIAIIVPCHRVVGRSGLGGFSGGLHIKRFLLELEGAPIPPPPQA
ncbi:MAG: methylated-DNA--[protein]-cysteine S-methyltransferase [Firmicutes bacterium]|nr:methylated-DNA--[protein]-cysteine S-methyltransferase [Bacillota bacterium]